MEPVYGIHLGMVISDGPDPEGRNRIQVWVPHLSNTLYKSINSKLTDPKFNDGKDLSIKSPSDLDALDPNIVKTLRTTLPWAEYGAPLFGGSSASYSNATGITSTTNTTRFSGIYSLNAPKIESAPNSLNNDATKPNDPSSLNGASLRNPDGSIIVNFNNGRNVSQNIDGPSNVGGVRTVASGGFDSADARAGIVVSNSRLTVGNMNGAPVAYAYPKDGGSPIPLYGQDVNPTHGFGNITANSNEPVEFNAYALDLLGLKGNVNSVSGSGSYIIKPSPEASAIIGENSQQTITNNLGESGPRGVTYKPRSGAYMKESNIATAGSAAGTYTTPKAGSKVWVFFVGGDIQRPVYFARAVNKGEVGAAFTG